MYEARDSAPHDSGREVTLIEDLDDEPTQRWIRPETFEDWPGQLRKSSILLPITALLVALLPLLLVLVWLSQ